MGPRGRLVFRRGALDWLGVLSSGLPWLMVVLCGDLRLPLWVWTGVAPFLHSLSHCRPSGEIPLGANPLAGGGISDDGPLVADNLAQHMKPGKNLERLVAALERVLAGSSAKVEAPSRSLIDKDTGRRREHDVLITWDHGHHKIITAIECKDHRRRIGVQVVEAFADKCRATGVHSGVIVSARGFTATARKKAEALSITCMDLEVAESFNWLLIDSAVHYLRCFGDMDLQVELDSGPPEAIAAIFDGVGTQLSQNDLMATFRNLVPAAEDPETEVGKHIPITMKVLTPGWTAADANGTVWTIVHILVRTSYTVNKSSLPLERHRYKGGGKQYNLATVKTNIEGVHGSFMMIQNDADGQTALHWVPEAPAGSA